MSFHGSTVCTLDAESKHMSFSTWIEKGRFSITERVCGFIDGSTSHGGPLVYALATVPVSANSM